MLLGDATAMQGVSSALQTSVTPNTILSPIVDLLPFLGIMLVPAIGYFLIKKVLKKTSKLKAGV